MGSAGRTECIPSDDTAFDVRDCGTCNVEACSAKFPIPCARPTSVVNAQCVTQEGWLLQYVPILFLFIAILLLIYGLFVKKYDGYNDERGSPPSIPVLTDPQPSQYDTFSNAQPQYASGARSAPSTASSFVGTSSSRGISNLQPIREDEILTGESATPINAEESVRVGSEDLSTRDPISEHEILRDPASPAEKEDHEVSEPSVPVSAIEPPAVQLEHESLQGDQGPTSDVDTNVVPATSQTRETLVEDKFVTESADLLDSVERGESLVERSYAPNLSSETPAARIEIDEGLEAHVSVPREGVITSNVESVKTDPVDDGRVSEPSDGDTTEAQASDTADRDEDDLGTTAEEAQQAIAHFSEPSKTQVIEENDSFSDGHELDKSPVPSDPIGAAAVGVAAVGVAAAGVGAATVAAILATGGHDDERKTAGGTDNDAVHEAGSTEVAHESVASELRDVDVDAAVTVSVNDEGGETETAPPGSSDVVPVSIEGDVLKQQEIAEPLSTDIASDDAATSEALTSDERAAVGGDSGSPVNTGAMSPEDATPPDVELVEGMEVQVPPPTALETRSVPAARDETFNFSAESQGMGIPVPSEVPDEGQELKSEGNQEPITFSHETCDGDPTAPLEDAGGELTSDMASPEDVPNIADVGEDQVADAIVSIPDSDDESNVVTHIDEASEPIVADVVSEGSAMAGSTTVSSEDATNELNREDTNIVSEVDPAIDGNAPEADPASDTDAPELLGASLVPEGEVLKVVDADVDAAGVAQDVIAEAETSSDSGDHAEGEASAIIEAETLPTGESVDGTDAEVADITIYSHETAMELERESASVSLQETSDASELALESNLQDSSALSDRNVCTEGNSVPLEVKPAAENETTEGTTTIEHIDLLPSSRSDQPTPESSIEQDESADAAITTPPETEKPVSEEITAGAPRENVDDIIEDLGDAACEESAPVSGSVQNNEQSDSVPSDTRNRTDMVDFDQPGSSDTSPFEAEEAIHDKQSEVLEAVTEERQDFTSEKEAAIARGRSGSSEELYDESDQANEAVSEDVAVLESLHLKPIEEDKIAQEASGADRDVSAEEAGREKNAEETETNPDGLNMQDVGREDFKEQGCVDDAGVETERSVAANLVARAIGVKEDVFVEKPIEDEREFIEANAEEQTPEIEKQSLATDVPGDGLPAAETLQSTLISETVDMVLSDEDGTTTLASAIEISGSSDKATLAGAVEKEACGDDNSEDEERTRPVDNAFLVTMTGPVEGEIVGPQETAEELHVHKAGIAESQSTVTDPQETFMGSDEDDNVAQTYEAPESDSKEEVAQALEETEVEVEGVEEESPKADRDETAAGVDEEVPSAKVEERTLAIPDVEESVPVMEQEAIADTKDDEARIFMKEDVMVADFEDGVDADQEAGQEADHEADHEAPAGTKEEAVLSVDSATDAIATEEETTEEVVMLADLEAVAISKLERDAEIEEETVMLVDPEVDPEADAQDEEECAAKAIGDASVSRDVMEGDIMNSSEEAAVEASEIITSDTYLHPAVEAKDSASGGTSETAANSSENAGAEYREPEVDQSYEAIAVMTPDEDDEALNADTTAHIDTSEKNQQGGTEHCHEDAVSDTCDVASGESDGAIPTTHYGDSAEERENIGPLSTEAVATAPEEGATQYPAGEISVAADTSESHVIDLGAQHDSETLTNLGDAAEVGKSGAAVTDEDSAEVSESVVAVADEDASEVGESVAAVADEGNVEVGESVAAVAEEDAVEVSENVAAVPDKDTVEVGESVAAVTDEDNAELGENVVAVADEDTAEVGESVAAATDGDTGEVGESVAAVTDEDAVEVGETVAAVADEGNVEGGENVAAVADEDAVEVGESVAAVADEGNVEVGENVAAMADEGDVEVVENVAAVTDEDAAEAVADEDTGDMGESVAAVADEDTGDMGENVPAMTDEDAAETGESVAAVPDEDAVEVGESVTAVADEDVVEVRKSAAAVPDEDAVEAGESVSSMTDGDAVEVGENVATVADKDSSEVGESVAAVADEDTAAVGESVVALADEDASEVGKSVAAVADEGNVEAGENVPAMTDEDAVEVGESVAAVADEDTVEAGENVAAVGDEDTVEVGESVAAVADENTGEVGESVAAVADEDTGDVGENVPALTDEDAVELGEGVAPVASEDAVEGSGEIVAQSCETVAESEDEAVAHESASDKIHDTDSFGRTAVEGNIDVAAGSMEADGLGLQEEVSVDALGNVITGSPEYHTSGSDELAVAESLEEDAAKVVTEAEVATAGSLEEAVELLEGVLQEGAASGLLDTSSDGDSGDSAPFPKIVAPSEPVSDSQMDVPTSMLAASSEDTVSTVVDATLEKERP